MNTPNTLERQIARLMVGSFYHRRRRGVTEVSSGKRAYDL
jgi:hypothetical protein